MSEQNSGPGDKGGFGPKKPKATFGDVMLGIRAGQGGAPERDRGGKGDRGGRGGDRRDRDRKPESRPGQQAAGAEGAQAGSAPEQAEPKKARPPEKREKKQQGPMVVVKRATGQVETRPLGQASAEGASTAPESTEAAASEAPAQEATPAAVEHKSDARKPEPRKPEPVRSALYEEVPEDQSFAEMFEAQQKQDSSLGRRTVRVGEKVQGKIFQLGADTAFVSLGGKSEAMIELRELKDEEGVLRFGVGDEIEAFVTEAGAKGIILSKQLAKGAASMSMLADARISGMPVEGLVLSVNKGGLEVAVGDVRAFCPISQIDLRFVEKPDQFVGERLKFRVTEVRERNVVLSRRALLEEEQKAKAAETLKKLTVGAVMSGKVTGVRDFGAFVDLGGVEGMIPVSEMSHVRIGHPSEVVKAGEDVEVEVIRMEAGNPNSPDKAKQKDRITLSMRSRQEDPFKQVMAEIQEGARLQGKVVRLQPFGAFVELRPGVDGLIHISAMSDRRIAHPRDVLQVGQEIEVQVDKIDPSDKRIGLRLVKDGQVMGAGMASAEAASQGQAAQGGEQKPSAERPRVGQVVTGKIDRIEPYGVFVAFPGGKGLVPASETGTDRGTDMKRAFSLGQELKVAILDMEGGKIRLSITGAARAEERADMEAWQKSQPKGTGGKGFGTLADLLKGRKI